MNRDMVMFIPACGLGERVADRGVKPFLNIKIGGTEIMALDAVMAQAPDGLPIEIALRKEMGCPPLSREAVVHFMEPTTGQAETIYRWLRRTKLRQHVLISNCDNVIDDASIEHGIRMLDENKCNGVVFTFRPEPDDARWSYVNCGPLGFIGGIEEKKVISKDAVAGVYLLNMFSLRMALEPSDKYLSQTLARMNRLIAIRSLVYRGWNDLQQLNELEGGL